MHCKKVLFVYCCCATDDLIQELLHLVESGVHAADARSTYLGAAGLSALPNSRYSFLSVGFWGLRRLLGTLWRKRAEVFFGASASTHQIVTTGGGQLRAKSVI